MNMTSYGEKKHAQGPLCTGTGCEELATKLMLRAGRPWWVCPEHYEEEPVPTH